MIPKTYAVTIDPTIFPPAGSFPTIASLVNTIIPNILVIAGIVFFIIFVSAGFQLLAAGQVDPQKLEKTRKTMTDGLIGFIIIVIAYWLVIIIGKVTGVNITEPNL